METTHQKRLQAEFRELLIDKRLEVMEIPDRYRYMDPELIKIFEAEAEAFVQEQV